MLLRVVVGFEISGNRQEGGSETELVVTVVEMWRTKGVVGKCVEFYGDGIKN